MSDASWNFSINADLSVNGNPQEAGKIRKQPEIKDEHGCNPEKEKLNTNDANDITTQESKNSKNTNISFVEAIVNPLARPDISNTMNILTKGFSDAVKMGNAAVSNGRISIPNDFKASIVLNVAIFTSGTPVANPGNAAEREKVMHFPVQTVAKMIKSWEGGHHGQKSELKDKSTLAKSPDFSNQETDFLKKIGIKVNENKDGQTQFLYYASDDSPPVELSLQDLEEILGHLENIQNDEELFKLLNSIGSKLDNMVKQKDENQNDSKAEIKNNEKPKESAAKGLKTQSDHNPESKAFVIQKEKFTKNSSPETNAILDAAERRKEEEIYHEKKLKQIDQARQQENHEKANKLTDDNVKKIREDAKLTNG
jgi:hypothetical protein